MLAAPAPVLLVPDAPRHARPLDEGAVLELVPMAEDGEEAEDPETAETDKDDRRALR